MKYMIILMVFLYGCTTGNTVADSTTADHIGCQEGEIIDGECVVADENNAMMFEGGDVKTMDVPNGYLAQPAEEGTYPGVVMIHEWWG